MSNDLWLLWHVFKNVQIICENNMIPKSFFLGLSRDEKAASRHSNSRCLLSEVVARPNTVCNQAYYLFPVNAKGTLALYSRY